MQQRLIPSNASRGGILSEMYGDWTDIKTMVEEALSWT